MIESKTEPSQNENLEEPDSNVALEKKCNDYYFEEYDIKNNKYDYYAWRNPFNNLRKNKIIKCRKQDNYGKKKMSQIT